MPELAMVRECFDTPERGNRVTVIRCLGGFLTAIALTLAFVSNAAAFSAGGSVEQVYATGLPAGAQVSLLNSAGQVIGDQERQRPRRHVVPRRHAGRRLPRPPHGDG